MDIHPHKKVFNKINIDVKTMSTNMKKFAKENYLKGLYELFRTQYYTEELREKLKPLSKTCRVSSPRNTQNDDQLISPQRHSTNVGKSKSREFSQNLHKLNTLNPSNFDSADDIVVSNISDRGKNERSNDINSKTCGEDLIRVNSPNENVEENKPEDIYDVNKN